MEDNQIVSLYWQRDESAITHTQKKYGNYCYQIAYNILNSREDAEESVNDTYMGAWNSIPPNRPSILSTYLGKITRRVSLKRCRSRMAEKRGKGALPLILDELAECIPAVDTVESQIEADELTAILNTFLEALPVDTRRVFLRRYWFCDPVADIAARYGYSESKVKMTLKRTRDRLALVLKEEGYA